MAPDLADHESRLRLLERTVYNLEFEAAASKAARDKVGPLIDELRQWQRDSARNNVQRQASLTRREKQLGLLVAFMSPILTLVAHHWIG